jgi:quercetin dioxygenase-like cupin family protein
VSDTELQPGYSAPLTATGGDVRSVFFQPDGYSLWLSRAQLAEGATLTWGSQHGDEAVYVIDGLVTIDGRTCPTGGMIVVEADVAAELHAEQPTTILHVGPTDPKAPTDGLLGPADPHNHQVHVFQPEDSVFIGTNVGQVNFTDSTCPTCRISVFRVDCSLPEFDAASHSHSEDEIIHVLSGSLQVGPQRVDAGMSVAIPGDRRYGFRATAPFSFFNFRRDASTMVFKPGDTPMLETVAKLQEFMAAHPDGSQEVVA